MYVHNEPTNNTGKIFIHYLHQNGHEIMILKKQRY